MISRSFSVHLVLVFFALILVTTVSAGVPAYLLTRAELQQQAWSHADDTQQATLALFQAEQNRLVDLARLTAERPTLQRLLQDGATSELPAYLQAIREQSGLDILLMCDTAERPMAGADRPATCADLPASGYGLFQARPAFLGSQRIFHEASGVSLGRIITGIWLDDSFLEQIAAETGVAQSILLPDGSRLASSLPRPVPPAEPLAPAASLPDREQIEIGGRQFYAVRAPLAAGDEPLIVAEVALPVDNLIATQRRALTVLAASTSLVAMLGASLGAWYARRMTAPLQKLTNAAGEISQGNFEAPVPLLAGPIEVTTLATALEESRTSMLHALHELAQARDWLNSLIQSIVEGVVTFDSQGRVTFLSQGAEVLTGWPAQEALGRHINELFTLADGRGDLFLDRIPAEGNKRQIDVLTRSGKSVVLAVTGARLASPVSNSVQIALVLRDVTEEEARRHLRSYFLANISHEFRTPLSALNASIELLMDEEEALSAAEMRELLKPAYLSLLGLQTLIDNLLESSSIEAGRFTMRQRLVSLNHVLAEAIQIVTPLLERRHQSLALSEPATFVEVHADPTRLMQVVVNLLSNASKYSPLGEHIDLLVEQGQDRLRVCVADRGPGVPPVERANLFRRFVRLNEQDGEQYGVGLGLYVVKVTVEAHGGRVGVDDRPGGGSVFWFELPLTAAGANL
jgi:PAS domain S-box-containing protein